MSAASQNYILIHFGKILKGCLDEFYGRGHCELTVFPWIDLPLSSNLLVICTCIVADWANTSLHPFKTPVISFCSGTHLTPFERCSIEIKKSPALSLSLMWRHVTERIDDFLLPALLFYALSDNCTFIRMLVMIEQRISMEKLRMLREFSFVWFMLVRNLAQRTISHVRAVKTSHFWLDITENDESSDLRA